HHALDPSDPDCQRQCAHLRGLLDKLRLRCVIETGARFLLDPRRKHQPTLLSARVEERQRRVDFLKRSIQIAAELNADAVSFWSGTPDEAAPAQEHWTHLVDGCRRLCDDADRHNMRLAFEPEPGMFIDTMAKYEELHGRISHPRFGLTLDLGHLHCQGE